MIEVAEREGDPGVAVTLAHGGPVLIGGYHGQWLPQATGVQLSRPEVPVGPGNVVALGADTCPLGEVQRTSGTT